MLNDVFMFSFFKENLYQLFHCFNIRMIYFFNGFIEKFMKKFEGKYF